MNPEKSGSSKKKILAVVGAAIVAILVAGSEEIGQGYGKQLWRKLTGADTYPVVEEVRETAARINREVPRMLDSATRLDQAYVGADNKQLILAHTLLLWRATEITGQQLQDALAARIKASSCGTEDQVTLLKAGLTLIFRYNSRDGIFVADIPVSQIGLLRTWAKSGVRGLLAIELRDDPSEQRSVLGDLTKVLWGFKLPA
jgi:hypothetical protein